MTGPIPGPWRVKPEPSNTIGCRTIQGPKSGSHKQAQHTDIAFTVGLRNDELDKANANLLAAASELLEALKAFLLSKDTEIPFYCDYCCEQAEIDDDGNMVGPLRHALGCPDPIARLVILKAEGGGEAI